jgi:hypothetical protein
VIEVDASAIVGLVSRPLWLPVIDGARTASRAKLNPRAPKRLDLGTAKDIAAWLRGLGLEEFEPAFHDDRVDAEILPKLQGSQRRQVGDRRKLLESTAALREGAVPISPVPAAAGRYPRRSAAAAPPGLLAPTPPHGHGSRWPRSALLGFRIRSVLQRSVV